MTTPTGGRAASALGRLVRTSRDRWILGIGAAVTAAVLIAGGLLVYTGTHRPMRITAYFTETIGVYPGSTVRVLGVAVGKVDAVQPDGRQVKVTMTVDRSVAIPAGASAAVVTPSVVADRYIQLVPAYTGGPRMADGAVIPAARTAVPMEVDQVYSSLVRLATTLGPAGANRQGALSGLIRTGAANLAGNGRYLRDMVTEFGGLSRTLGGSAGNLFASIANLQRFTTMLKANDGQVRQAEGQLAQVFGFLASDRQNLTAAISELATALGQVNTFIGSNRALITANVSKLATITSLLARERASLAEALDVAPLAADNLVGAYDAVHHTLLGRGDINEFSMGPGALSPFTAAYSVSGAFTAPFGSVPVPASRLGWLPPLPLPVVGAVYGTPQAILRGGR